MLRRAVLRLSCFALLSYVMGMVVLLFFENKIIFPAPRYPVGDWSPAGLEYEDVFFTSGDGTKLHGWHVKHPRPRAHLLFCHGNGEHVGSLAGLLQELRDEFQVSVFAFDYRGYGRSEGRPDERGVLTDGRAAHEKLARLVGIEPNQVVLMGRSLGGAVAVDLAASHGARGLVLISTFTSLPDVAAIHYPWAPVRWLMRSQLDSRSKITRYHGPLLQYHGTADEVVPFELGQALFEAASGHAKRFLEIPGGTHNEPLHPTFYVEMEQFLANLQRPATPHQ